jgi:hypothetical protein
LAFQHVVSLSRLASTATTLYLDFPRLLYSTDDAIIVMSFKLELAPLVGHVILRPGLIAKVAIPATIDLLNHEWTEYHKLRVRKL